MIPNYFWFLVFLLHYTLGYTPVECPSKEMSKASCENEQPCTDKNHLCFAQYKEDLSQIFHCCDATKTFCPDTDMIFVKMAQWKPHVSPLWSNANTHSTYPVNLTINGDVGLYACPIPYSYQFYWSDLKPVDFKPGKKVKKCKISEECKDDEFCGHVYSGTQGDIYRDPSEYRSSMDRSDFGKSFQFCYKIPEAITNITAQTGHTIDRKAVGFTVCEDNSNCTGGSTCFTSDAIVDLHMHCITPDGKNCDKEEYRGGMPKYPGVCLSFVSSILVLFPLVLTIVISMHLNKLV